MINELDNIKVVIFDFDNTLAIHKDKEYLQKRKDNKEVYINYLLNAYLNPDTFYDEIEICYESDILKKLINYLKDRNIKMYCVSGMKFSFDLQAKKNFIKKHYNEDIEIITSSSQKLKINAVEIISKINNCNYNKILFIDELIDNVEQYKQIGINALLPNEVEKELQIN